MWNEKAYLPAGVAEVLTVMMILLLLSSIGLIAVVILQSGHSAGLSGAIAGGAETIFGKKKGLDDFLARLTVVLGAVFFLSGIVIAILERH